MPYIYRDGKRIEVRKLSEVGRTDWHHNSEGKVDYLPIGGKGSKPIPLSKQKYELEDGREEGIQNLISHSSSKPNWKEYERIQREFN